MARNMSFSKTTKQVRDRTKTVTRRNGWRVGAEVGAVLNACERCQGLKKGEKVVKLAQIRVVSERWEPLRRLTDDPVYGAEECIKEGFPDMTPAEFVAFYCRFNKCTADKMVHRIEFEYEIIAPNHRVSVGRHLYNPSFVWCGQCDNSERIDTFGADCVGFGAAPWSGHYGSLAVVYECPVCFETQWSHCDKGGYRAYLRWIAKRGEV